MTALHGLLEILASIPVISVSPKDRIKVDSYKIKSNSFSFNLAVAILFILFCLTLGRGFIL